MHKLVLQNQGIATYSKQIYLRIEHCQPGDLKTGEETCADKADLKDYYSNLSLEVLELTNFIDYQRVKAEPFEQLRQNLLV